MDKLDNCPFCGGESELVSLYKFGSTDVLVHDELYVQCRVCNIRTPSQFVVVGDNDRFQAVKNQLIDSWNRRATNFPRPKSRWVLDGNHCYCERCKAKVESDLTHFLDLKFCPECGAEM